MFKSVIKNMCCMKETQNLKEKTWMFKMLMSRKVCSAKQKLKMKFNKGHGTQIPIIKFIGEHSLCNSLFLYTNTNP